MTTSGTEHWKIYQGNGEERSSNVPLHLPPAPPWRQFQKEVTEQQNLKGRSFQPPAEAIEMVNVALSLRRPLLITGSPGAGKSSLAYAVAWELGLGNVLRWSITTRSTLQDGLYGYDAIARLQDAQASRVDNRQDTGNYITLGPLGTAFLPTALPRVLLIDEIDKSDIDLPNNLLNLLEEGEFPIPELQRLELPIVGVRTIERDERNNQIKVGVENGVVRCHAFPLVIMTSNGERDFPPPFLRRCLRLKMPNPSPKELQGIVEKHLGTNTAEQSKELIQWFCKQIEAGGTLATDQLLNAIHIRTQENTRPTQQTQDIESLDGLAKLTLAELEKRLSLTDAEQRLLKDLSSPEDV
jgi:MoxR-like ATPase